MAIRIERIQINRGGPLAEDFELEPADLTLVYGRNETGKTYLVESLIQLLFRTKGKGAGDWGLRDWEPSGKVRVSGLETDPVSFTKTGKKLEDYWVEEQGLPQCLARLLVVRAGDTSLAPGAGDGVGDDLLKDILSGERLLDEIEGRISKTVQDATIADGRPVGPNRGEIKDWNGLRERLDALGELLNQAEAAFSTGAVYELRRRQEALSARLGDLERARRHRAYRLQQEIRKLETQRAALPDEAGLTAIQDDNTVYKERRRDEARRAKAVGELEGAEDDHRWAVHARDVYQKVTSQGGAAAPSWAFLWVALAAILVAGASGLMGFAVPAGVLALIATGALLAHYGITRRAASRAGDSQELEALRREFRTRSGTELTDRAALEAYAEKLQGDNVRFQTAKGELERLTAECEKLADGIANRLRAIAGEDVPVEGWDARVSELRRQIANLEHARATRREDLARLGVDEAAHLADDPGVSWDPAEAATLVREQAEVARAIQAEMDLLSALKSRVQGAAASTAGDWESLVADLRARHEETSAAYRQLTAQILAQVQVKAAVEEFRAGENARIDAGLGRAELTRPLQALTTRYRAVKRTAAGGLLLVTEKDEEYPLANVSTGAREQAFLAMRIGFASIAMAGQPAFLILDDAFQHSDWGRRRNLVDQTVKLVEEGWQVITFSMDDHIRDLFREAGGGLGGRFSYSEIA